MNTATPNASKLFDHHKYFETRKGLLVFDGFENHVLPYQKPTARRGLDGLMSILLPGGGGDTMSHIEIITEILGGMDNARRMAPTLCQIADMIDLQPNGEDGVLLNDGNLNVFYVLVKDELFGIHVGWSDDEWEVDVSWSVIGNSGGFFAGTQVFLNTILKP